MPAIILPEQYSLWLKGTEEEARNCINQIASSDLEAYKISTSVNNPSFDDPAIVEPIKSND